LDRVWLEEMELGYRVFYGKELTAMRIRLDKFPDTVKLRKRLMEIAAWNAIFIGPRHGLPYMKKVIAHYMRMFPEASDDDVITADRCFCRMDLVQYEVPSPINHTVMKIRYRMGDSMEDDSAFEAFLTEVGSSMEEFFDYLLCIGEEYVGDEYCVVPNKVQNQTDNGRLEGE
jgi:hypothetical protein